MHWKLRTTPTHTSLARRLRYTLTACLLASLLAVAWGQNQLGLLPERTIAALGMVDLETAAEISEDFRQELNERGLQDLLAIFMDEEFPSEEELELLLGGFSVLDFLGQEAWVVVSDSAFSPLPVVSLMTELSAEVRPLVAEIIADADWEAEQTEGNFTFYEMLLEDPDIPLQAFAFALADDVLMLSSDPETLRGMLRRLAGSSQGSLAATELFSDTFGLLSEGTFYAYVNYAAIAASLEPFAFGFGFDALADKLLAALRTAGATAGMIAFEEDAIIGEGVQRVDPDGGDPALYELLTLNPGIAFSSASSIPQDVLSYAIAGVDVEASWDYLNSIAMAVPELGGDLDMLLMSFGIDFRSTILPWIGNEAATIATDVSQTVSPGVPSDNLLGEIAVLLEANDEAAASVGLEQFLTSLTQTAAMLGDPQGGMGDVQISSSEIAGVSVTRYDATEGVRFFTAVHNGFAIVATSEDAMEQLLNDQPSVSDDPAMAEELAEVAAEGFTSVSFTDSQRSTEVAAEQVREQVQLLAGLGGAAGLDFDTTERSAAAAEEILLFIASRIGDTYAVTGVEGNVIFNYSETEVTW